MEYLILVLITSMLHMIWASIRLHNKDIIIAGLRFENRQLEKSVVALENANRYLHNKIKELEKND